MPYWPCYTDHVTGTVTQSESMVYKHRGFPMTDRFSTGTLVSINSYKACVRGCTRHFGCCKATKANEVSNKDLWVTDLQCIQAGGKQLHLESNVLNLASQHEILRATDFCGMQHLDELSAGKVQHITIRAPKTLLFFVPQDKLRWLHTDYNIFF